MTELIKNENQLTTDYRRKYVECIDNIKQEGITIYFSNSNNVWSATTRVGDVESYAAYGNTKEEAIENLKNHFKDKWWGDGELRDLLETKEILNKGDIDNLFINEVEVYSLIERVNKLEKRISILENFNNING